MAINLDHVTEQITVTDTATDAGLTFVAKGGSGFDFQNSATSGALGIELAGNTTVDKTTFIDFHSSASTDFDFRLSRNPSVNGNAVYQNQGTGSHIVYTGTNANQFTVAHTASAVNYIQVSGSVTSSAPYLLANGSDTNVPLVISSKGSSSILFKTAGTTPTQMEVSHTASAVNYVQVTGAATGVAPVLSAQGSDTNIDLNLTPKGTGKVRFGTHTGTADTAVSGYIEIKDSGGTIRKLAVIT
jgi:hypothetical protein